MTTIRAAQFFELIMYDSNGNKTSTNYYQNYFIGETKQVPGSNVRYTFAPFRIEGTVANLGGDNAMMQLLLPNDAFAMRIVEQGNGNRLARLTLTTYWLNAINAFTGASYREQYIGIGSAFSDTTIELRFRSSMDSVGGQFPRATFSRSLVGPLPTSAEISLR
jgi:hypothetical protein